MTLTLLRMPEFRKVARRLFRTLARAIWIIKPFKGGYLGAFMFIDTLALTGVSIVESRQGVFAAITIIL